MLIALTVISDRTFLHKLFNGFKSYNLFSVNFICCNHGKLNGIHSLANISSATRCYFLCTFFGHFNIRTALLGKKITCTVNRLFNLIRINRLKFKNSRTAQNCVIYIKIRIFGCWRNQRDTAVFNVFEQSLLLLFIKILNFVKIEQNSVKPRKSVKLCNNILYVGSWSRCAVKLFEGTVCLFCNICGKRSFSNPRRTVENKIRNISAFNNFTQRSVGCNKMLLSHNVINCLWTNPVRKRFVHNITPCRWFCCKNNYISYSTFVRTFCQVKVTAIL